MANVENTISLSREDIKNLILSQMQTYLDLKEVDLTKTSFLSFVIETMTTLSNNLLFYSASLWKEYFLTRCQLPESIYEGAASLGYNKKYGSPASVDALIKMTANFQQGTKTFEFPKYSQFEANDIIFQTYYHTLVTVVTDPQNDPQVTVVLTDFDNIVAPNTIGPFSVPVYIGRDNNNNDIFSFLLPLKQFTIKEETFTMDEDENIYMFKEFFVDIEKDYFSTNVSVIEDGTETQWQYYNSLYLIPPEEKAYTTVDREDGIKFLFGNSLMGKRPKNGDIIKIGIYETKGSQGNIIPGSLLKGPKLYLTSTEIPVSYSVTNPAPGFGGTDSETLEEIRTNAITNLTALSRLVSENDYKNINAIIPNFPLSPDYIPILKRADTQGNEISIYSPIFLNTSDTEDSSIPFSTNSIWYQKMNVQENIFTISRETPLTNEDEKDSNGYNIEYISPFDIEANKTRKSATYFYYIKKIELAPRILLQNNSEDDITKNVSCQIVSIEDDGNDHIKYTITTSVSGTFSNLEVNLEIEGDLTAYTSQVNGSDDIIISVPKSEFKEGELKHELTFKENAGSSNEITWLKEDFYATIKKDLKFLMKSNVTVENNDTVTIYDIPCVLKEKWDNLDDSQKVLFESLILQKIVSLDLTGHRMISDFINIKFTKTSGKLTNIFLNKKNKLDSINGLREGIPSPINDGERYILTDYGEHQNDIVTYLGSGSYDYYTPLIDDCVYNLEDGEIYFYTEEGWIVPDISIPFEIEVDVVKDPSYIGTTIALKESIKDAIYDGLKDRFGNDANIYRSQITDIVQNVDGVSHCSVVKPEVNLFFDFKLEELDQEELLKYTPTYIYTIKENIKINLKQ